MSACVLKKKNSVFISNIVNNKRYNPHKQELFGNFCNFSPDIFHRRSVESVDAELTDVEGALCINLLTHILLNR